MKPTSPCPRCGARQSIDGLCPRCELAVALEPSSPIAPEAGLEPSVSARRFGDYELLEEIGHGGMGVVYKARHVKLNRLVALKLLLLGQFSSEQAVKRFQREAQAAAALRHPNIIGLHDVGEIEGQHYFTMELVEGRSLAAMLRDGPLPPPQAAAFCRAIAGAISAAHVAGIIHRDLKPSNILIDLFDQPRITDFGLAKRLDGSGDITLTGHVLGSPNYLAPELAAGHEKQCGPGTDIFSIGAILYECLTGRPPFLAATLQETLLRIRDTEPVAPRVLNATLPLDLQTICLKCLEKEPSRRYTTAQELADELDRFLRDEPIHARPIGRTARCWRWCRRKPALAASLAAVLVLALVLVVGSPIAIFRINQARKAEAAERERAEANLYASDMNLAYQAIQGNNLGRATTLLERHRPKGAVTSDEWRVTGEASKSSQLITHHSSLTTDLRGWEWHYLASQARSDEIATLTTHSNFVVGLAVSPDGRWVASGDMDGQLKLTDVATRREVTNFTHPDSVFAVAFSPDGKLLASGTDNEAVIRLWSLPGFKPLPSLTNETRMQRLAFSPDNRLLAAGANVGVSLWDLGSRRRVGEWFAQRPWLDPVGLAFSPDDRLLVANRGDGSFYVIDVATRQEITRVKAHEESVKSLIFSRDGQRLWSAGDKTVRLWSVPDWKPLGSFTNHDSLVFALALSPDERTLATGSQDQRIRLWNSADGKERVALQGHRQGVFCTAFLPDGSGLVSGSVDETVRLWPAESNISPPRSVAFSDALEERFNLQERLVLSPDGLFLATVFTNNTFSVWNTATLTESHRWPAPLVGLRSIGIAPGGRTVALGFSNGVVKLWDAVEGRELETLLQVTNIVHRLQFSADGTKLAVKAYEDWAARVIDLPTRQTSRFESKASSYSMAMAFDHANQRLAIANFYPEVEVFTLNGGRAPLILRGHKLQVRGVAFLPGANQLATCGADGTLRIWDLKTGEEISRLDGEAGVFVSLAASPDGRRLAAGTDSGVKLWDSRTLQELLTLAELKPGGIALGFHADGQTLVNASRDTLRVWRAGPGTTFPPTTSPGVNSAR